MTDVDRISFRNRLQENRSDVVAFPALKCNAVFVPDACDHVTGCLFSLDSVSGAFSLCAIAYQIAPNGFCKFEFRQCIGPFKIMAIRLKVAAFDVAEPISANVTALDRY